MASAMQELSSFSGFEIFYSFEGAAETHGEEHAQNFCEKMIELLYTVYSVLQSFWTHFLPRTTIPTPAARR